MTYTCALLKVAPATYADIKRRVMAVNQHGDYDHMFHGTDEGQGIDLTHIMVIAEKPIQRPGQNHHDLKAWPEFFNALADGSKPFEVRRDDRGYQPGDTLTIRHYDPKSGLTPGVEPLHFTVTYVLREFPGLASGYVALGIEPA